MKRWIAISICAVGLLLPGAEPARAGPLATLWHRQCRGGHCAGRQFAEQVSPLGIAPQSLESPRPPP